MGSPGGTEDRDVAPADGRVLAETRRTSQPESCEVRAKGVAPSRRLGRHGVGVTLRSAWLLYSRMYIVPVELKRTSNGLDNWAAVARPPSPYGTTPQDDFAVPAMVVMMPVFLSTRRIAALLESAICTLSWASTVSEKGLVSRALVEVAGPPSPHGYTLQGALCVPA